jgi:hypothetical protein
MTFLVIIIRSTIQMTGQLYMVQNASRVGYIAAAGHCGAHRGESRSYLQLVSVIRTSHVVEYAGLLRSTQSIHHSYSFAFSGREFSRGNSTRDA